MKGTNRAPLPICQLETGRQSGNKVNMDNLGMSARLEAGLAAKQLKQSDVARKAGVSRQIISQVKSGEKTAQRVVKIAAEMLECSVEWLTNGSGPAPSWAIDETHYRRIKAESTKAAEAETIAEYIDSLPRSALLVLIKYAVARLESEWPPAPTPPTIKRAKRESMKSQLEKYLPTPVT